jgi:hypothetical protein
LKLKHLLQKVRDRSRKQRESGALNILSLTDLEAVFAALDDPRLPPAVPVALRHHASLDEQAVVDQVHGAVVVVAQVVVPREPELDLQEKAHTLFYSKKKPSEFQVKASFHKIVVAQVVVPREPELDLEKRGSNIRLP